MTEPDVRTTNARAEAVFIVGVSRSGTTLMRKTLSTSSALAIAHENHFLGHLLPLSGMRHRIHRLGDLHDDLVVDRFIAALYGGSLRDEGRLRGTSRQWRWIAAKVDRQELRARILASDRSDRALFTIMMRVYADHYAKPVMGEKTPAHLRYVPTLLRWFPGARVIHMVRDPRGVYVSELRRRRTEAVTTPYRQLRRFGALFSGWVLLQTTALWLEGALRDARYRRRYGARYRLVRFEDLVQRPESTVRSICDFLGIEFEPAMLRQTVVSRGFQAGTEGFDAAAADRWREHIGPAARRWLSTVLRVPLRRLGYER